MFVHLKILEGFNCENVPFPIKQLLNTKNKTIQNRKNKCMNKIIQASTDAILMKFTVIYYLGKSKSL